MANKYDLQTWSKLDLTSAVGASGTNIGSDKVADGKTRFLTHIRVTRTGEKPSEGAMTSLLIGIAEVTTSKPAAASVLDADYLKTPIHFPAVSKVTTLDGVVLQEMSGSVEHPILSVAGGKYMGIGASLTAGKTADVFAQFYDE